MLSSMFSNSITVSLMNQILSRVCACIFIYPLHLHYHQYHLCNCNYSGEYILIGNTKSFPRDSKQIPLLYLRSNQSGFSCVNSLYPRAIPLFCPFVKVMELSLINTAAKQYQKEKYWSSIKEGFAKKLKRGNLYIKNFV